MTQAPTNTMTAYLQQISRIPLLTREQEIEYGKQVQLAIALYEVRASLLARLGRFPTYHEWSEQVEISLGSGYPKTIAKLQQAITKELLKEFQLIVDSMEQPRERPSDNQEQKEYFSGKKKQHTFKNQFIILPEGKDIVDVEVGEKGPKSDINLFREQQEKFEAEQMFAGDKAYQKGENIITPHKKPRTAELTANQKAENKEFSGERIFVEHVIRIVKIFQIARQRFPLNSRVYEEVILTICGLVRLRIGALILPSSPTS
ncbi:transposase family protein [Scytonema sp. UIC 10036]|uniref:transposase family protein n=1 Tax=Scytonema sp. UIC 10036 TaxID=2304196 RepID=UPI00140FAFFE|nr:transposase family protein [Scytonema sp. UIC 10036]